MAARFAMKEEREGPGERSHGQLVRMGHFRGRALVCEVEETKSRCGCGEASGDGLLSDAGYSISGEYWCY